MKIKPSATSTWKLGLGRALLGTGLVLLASVSDGQAQVATAGGGVLVSKRSPQPVVELHGETPPFAGARAYITLS